MKTLHKTALVLLALTVQGCVIDLDHHHEPHRRRHLAPVDRGHLGAVCSADYQCASGLACVFGSCEPERVGIYVHGALVGPGRADGREWDAGYAVPRYVWRELDLARSAGVDALFDFMWSFSQSGYSAPDVFGYAYMAVDGRYDDALTIALAEPHRRLHDTFEVIWPEVSGWTDVPLHEGLWIAIDLFDHDRDGDESIGLVEIDAWGILEALRIGGVVWFDAWDATDGQLLLVGIEVVSESW